MAVHLLGEKNGPRIGSRSNIAQTAAEEMEMEESHALTRQKAKLAKGFGFLVSVLFLLRSASETGLLLADRVANKLCCFFGA